MTTPTLEPRLAPETTEPAAKSFGTPAAPAPSRLTLADVWREIERTSFAVLSWTTPRGEPRSSGIVYGAAHRKIYVAVAPDSWKARQIVTGQRAALTVTVRRGGLLSLIFPIPPATISFQAKVRVHPSGTLDLAQVSPSLKKLLPEERKAAACILELTPERGFLTFGIGVSLSDMRKPELSTARVAIE
jgi:hypothetical protein